MKNIRFTTGTLQLIGEYYNLVLMNGNKVVYKATVTTSDAATYMNEHNKIKVINGDS